MSTTKKPATTATTAASATARKSAAKSFDGFSDDERAAMKEHAQELKKTARRGASAAKQDGEADLLSKIAEMDERDRKLAERVHELVKANAPGLTPKTWYGMPAYARGTKLVCYFQPASKFKTRYATFAFNDGALLDDGSMWPTAYALTELTAADEARLGALVKKAAG
jgi:uncharacterized protein YdhG (YjbR/CyaY superfamily)